MVHTLILEPASATHKATLHRSTRDFSYSDATLDNLRRLFVQLNPAKADVTREQVEQAIQAPNTHLFFLYHQEVVMGVATLIVGERLRVREGYIEDVVVDEAYRGQGIGRALMQHVIEEGRALGLNGLRLTSRPSREAANALYVSLGFERYETNVYHLK